MNNEATFLDGKAKHFAKEWLRNEAHILETLSEMRAKRVFAELNYKGIFDYCVEALKLSNAQAFCFKSVAEKSEQVPQLAKAVKAGELSLSQARRIAPILTKENQAEWIEKAKTLPQPMLEREVTAVNPKAHVKEKIRPVVAKRDENRCTHTSRDGRRCKQTRWLHVHHLKEVSEGGLNTTENLRTLCQAHHGLQHAELFPK